MSRDREADRLRLVRLQRHTVEPLELTGRLAGHGRVADIELRDVAAADVAGVRDHGGHLEPAGRAWPLGVSGPEALLMTEPGVTVRCVKLKLVYDRP